MAINPEMELFSRFMATIISMVLHIYDYPITRRIHSIVASEWLTQGHAMHNTYEFVLL